MKLTLTLLLFQFLYSFNYAQTTKKIKIIKDSCSYYYDTIQNRNIFRVVDEMPSYVGGEDSIISIISRNLRWPSSGCDYIGPIYVGFIIEPNGGISNITILKGFDNTDLCNVNAEAIKATEHLKNWIPGKCYGELVPVTYAIPIRFKIE